MQELLELVRADGASPIDMIPQRRDRPDAATFIGSGKLAELAKEVAQTDVVMVVLTTELRPAQVKNLAEVPECKVLGRTELIRDLFAQHANIATYEFIYADGTKATLDIIAAGPRAEHFYVKPAEDASIQDWWPSFPQFERPQAKRVITADSNNSLGYIRYLYSLEWHNPHPDKVISRVRFASRSDIDSTIFLVAITALDRNAAVPCLSKKITKAA